MKTEKPIRSIAKSGTWRMIGLLDTMILSYLVTGRLVVALSIGGLELVTKSVLYYFHERAWSRFNWGRLEPNPQEINVVNESIEIEENSNTLIIDSWSTPREGVA